jgi:hypothetical protein
LPNNIVLFATIDKFDPNPMRVNINKLKPHMLIENITLQLVFAKPSDLVTNEPIQTKEPKPLPIELEYLQSIKFELVNNHLTHGSIKQTYVHVHYYHDVHVQNNNVTI